MTKSRMKDFFAKFGLIVLLLVLMSGCKDKIVEAEPEPIPSFAWETATPESLGVDADKLNEAFAGADKLNFVDGVVVIRNEKLIGEQYYNGFDKNAAHNVRSVSKSFLSALIGIAFDQGIIDGPDTKIMPFFEAYDSPSMDTRWKDVTIRHLMTMQSGLDNDENLLLDVKSSRDWIYTTLHQRLIFDPGSSYSYSTLGTHLLAVILTVSAEQTALDYATEHLFDPLGIKIRGWDKDPRGFYFGGSDMYFTPRDMARFGLLYLNGGKLDGKQIVPEYWVDASRQNQSLSGENSWGELEKIGYGLLWWLGEIDGYRVTIALGYGGQFIIIIPKLDTVLAITSDAFVSNWNTADSHERAVLGWVSQSILPAFVTK